MKAVKAWRKWGCLTALLLACAVCCAPVITVMSAAGALASRDASVPVDAVGGAAVGIPERMLAAYKNAAADIRSVAPKCRGMRWPVLAGIARIESNHAGGRTVTAAGDIHPRILGPVLNGSGVGGNLTAFPDTDAGAWDGDTRYERAVGPFQFLPATFRANGRDGNKDKAVDPHNADDAALSAALYLCGKGRNLTDRAQLKKAVFQYNHSDPYVSDVLSWIDRYEAAAKTVDLSGVTGNVATVLKAAIAQKGVPYSWGGGSPKGPSTGICCSPGGQNGTFVVGFDCSGLALYAFAQAGVTLPRTAAAQATVGKRIPPSAGIAALQPGDLVFFGYTPGVDSTIYHVGIALGNGEMINAARPGTKVRVDPVSAMSGFAGGARIL
ncbi:C40 family peptidase [Streptomyces sp. NBC_00306]|uniref:C40 family peptidase n=1 Tax=Streptomyces sp. NBC_00306 TaxID=2975708 RepID=UPI002E2A9519|nr:C40 family peptidase [Streptomyces sp. NBC_00306]